VSVLTVEMRARARTAEERSWEAMTCDGDGGGYGGNEDCSGLKARREPREEGSSVEGMRPLVQEEGAQVVQIATKQKRVRPLSGSSLPERRGQRWFRLKSSEGVAPDESVPRRARSRTLVRARSGEGGWRRGQRLTVGARPHANQPSPGRRVPSRW
jgi:hypothetical protein